MLAIHVLHDIDNDSTKLQRLRKLNFHINSKIQNVRKCVKKSLSTSQTNEDDEDQGENSFGEH